MNIRAYLGSHLRDSINDAAHSQNALNGAFLVIADGALGVGHFPNVRHILTSLTDDSGGFWAGDNSTNVDPGSLIVRTG